jgi:hypothetical protein
MVKYISTSMSGKGFITFADQQTDGLKFNIVATKDGINYVKIEGEEININKWMIRVVGTEVTLAVVNTVVASLPLSFEKQTQLDISILKSDIVTIKDDVAKLKAVKP